MTEAFEPITGTVQFGNTFDDWGNRFLCSESQPLLHAVLPLDDLARNPYLPVAAAIENVGGQAGADLPDQPDRALAADPLEPADRARRAVGRVGRGQPSRRRRRRGRHRSTAAGAYPAEVSTATSSSATPRTT